MNRPLRSKVQIFIKTTISNTSAVSSINFIRPTGGYRVSTIFGLFRPGGIVGPGGGIIRRIRYRGALANQRCRCEVLLVTDFSCAHGTVKRLKQHRYSVGDHIIEEHAKS